MRSHLSAKLIVSVIILILILVLAVLPGLASERDNVSAPYSSTNSSSTYSGNAQTGQFSESTPTPTILPTQSEVITVTQVTTPTYTASPEFTSSPTSSPSPTITATPTETYSPTLQPTSSFLTNLVQLIFLPDVYQNHTTPTPEPNPETALFCDDLSQDMPIPDNDASGVNDEITINDSRVVVNVRLYLDISHTWVGDLVVGLTHQDTGQSITVLNRPGELPYYCSNNDIVTILDDAAAQPADDKCATYPHAIAGIFQPSESFSAFSGESMSGTWRLNVSDNYVNDTGTLNHWCLEATLADSMPAPTPTPTPISLPSSAYVSGMSGYDQQLSLDCESRSAVDWARHFGKSIDEIGFLNHLPVSDDPEVGFVGNPNGQIGQIPPNDYGVHAPPVASLLNDYGLTASSYHSLQWDDLRAEIAAGNPVIVWITGGANYSLLNGTPHLYTAASTGNTTVVARGEHTVIVVGYSPGYVTVLNGSQFISVGLDQFLDSWSALDFMAVLARP